MSATPALFEPLALRDLVLANRVVVSPMCQYSSVDGCATDWHRVHVGNLALGGAGLVMMEMTDVEARGRITPSCLGLYDDACEAALEPVLAFARQYGTSPVGLQLAHAGRKASTRAPWEGRDALTPEVGGWEPVAPSAIASADGQLVPRALTTGEVEGLVEAFGTAAARAARLGFDTVQVHMAHGYLLHQFLSPLSNQRTDAYGGSAENRMRFPLAVFDAVRAAFPEQRPVSARVSGSDWVEDGAEIDDCIALCAALESRGCDWVDVSSGGLIARQSIPVGPGYQVHFAAQVRKATALPTLAVGMITEPAQANRIVSNGEADLVALGRGMLYDPRWTWHAAEALGAPEDNVDYPLQYRRARLGNRTDSFGERDRLVSRG